MHGQGVDRVGTANSQPSEIKFSTFSMSATNVTSRASLSLYASKTSSIVMDSGLGKIVGVRFVLLRIMVEVSQVQLLDIVPVVMQRQSVVH